MICSRCIDCVGLKFSWLQVPHILLLDEPTNHVSTLLESGAFPRNRQLTFHLQLDMESIDALAKAVNEFQGGLVLVSHDMRLIGQVAKEIWMCDNKCITKYKGDIQSFKMDMRAQMGIGEGESKTLRGDFSVKRKEGESKKEKPAPAPKAKLEVVVPQQKKASPPPHATIVVDDDDATAATVATATTSNSVQSSVATAADSAAPAKVRYIPPHLRKKMQQEKQESS